MGEAWIFADWALLVRLRRERSLSRRCRIVTARLFDPGHFTVWRGVRTWSPSVYLVAVRSRKIRRGSGAMLELYLTGDAEGLRFRRWAEV